MDSNARLARLERQVRSLSIAAGVSTGLLLCFSAMALRRPDTAAEVLRVRGLVVVDEAGRDRILIGAPIPASQARARTDMAQVRARWGKRFDPRYVTEWYPKYRNAVHGMVVMDENGIDRLAVGDSLPDPNIGRRIGSDVGILVNDAEGFERTGYGLLTVKGVDRAVLGLDGKEGTEGVALIVDDKGRRGMSVYDGPHTMFVGSSLFDTASGPFFGLVAREGKTVRHEVNTIPKP